MPREYRRFSFAHMQHHAVYDALINGQGARAEGIMREHANATLRYARTAQMGESGEAAMTVLRDG